MTKAEWLYERADAQLRQQLADVDSLDAKINAHFVVCGVLLGLHVHAMSQGPLVILIPSLGFLTGAMLLLLWAYQIADWHNCPNVDWLAWHQRYSDDLDEVISEAIEGLAGFYDANERLLEKKANKIGWAGLLIYAAVIWSSAGLVLGLS